MQHDDDDSSDALLLDAHRLLSELAGSNGVPTIPTSAQTSYWMSDTSSSGSAASASRDYTNVGNNCDDDDILWPQRTSDVLMDAMLFEDIESLLLTASSDLPPTLELPSLDLPAHARLQQQQQQQQQQHDAHSHNDNPHSTTDVPAVVNWVHTAPSPPAVTPFSCAAVDNDDDDDDMADTDETAIDPTVDSAHSHERELLVREVQFLEAQRDFLQFKADAAAATMRAATASNASADARDAAACARLQLDDATRHRALLVDLARQQQQSRCDLEVLLLQSPLNHYRIALMTPMESYIQLGRDMLERRATLLALRDAKIDATQQFIEFQAQHIDPAREFFYLDTFERFGKFYTVDFSVSKLHDTSGVDEIAAIIQDHFVTTNDGIAQLLGNVTNREFFDGMEMTFLNARTVDRVDVPKRHALDRGFVVQESNSVFYRKNLGDVTVMMCDYVNDDALHPYRTSGRIRKDISVGIVLSPVTNADGSTSVVMKRFSFIKHHFGSLQQQPSPEVLHAISTRVILWGQAIRTCILRRQRRKRKPIWHKYTFPRTPAVTANAVAVAATTGATTTAAAAAASDQSGACSRRSSRASSEDDATSGDVDDNDDMRVEDTGTDMFAS